MSEASTTATVAAAHVPTAERVASLASIVFCGLLPVLTLVAVFVGTVRDGSTALDFRPFFRAAEAILRGDNPYPAAGDLLTASGGPYVYPPVPAILTIPFTALPLQVAELLVMSLLVVSALAVPFVLGVRDWRCYGLLLLWPPVISAIQTGNPTLLLALAAALAWRFRDRPFATSASIGVTLATKFLLWPLVVWFAATRRLVSVALTCILAASLLLVSWAVIGFSGFVGYPGLLRRLEDTVGGDAYTVNVLALDLGASPGVARAAWLGLGLALLASVVAVGRRGGERSAFILAIAAALALSPLVWLHYFALLVIPVALAQPRLGLLWFVPLAMFVSPGTGTPSTIQAVVALGTASLTIALALRSSARAVGPAGSDPGLEARSEAARARAQPSTA